MGYQEECQDKVARQLYTVKRFFFFFFLFLPYLNEYLSSLAIN